MLVNLWIGLVAIGDLLDCRLCAIGDWDGVAAFTRSLCIAIAETRDPIARSDRCLESLAWFADLDVVLEGAAILSSTRLRT